MEPKKLTILTVPEAGAMWEPPLSRASSYRWAREGTMPGLVRKGRRLFVIKEAFLAGLGVPPDFGDETTNGDNEPAKAA